jgi:restriction system protein
MTIPDFQTIMLPLLQTIGDGKEWAMKDVTKAIEDQFKLSDEDRLAMLPSGYTRIIVNRVGWAKAHMKEAGLVEAVRRGIIRVTAAGKSVLADCPERIDLKFLERFPSYHQFRKKVKESVTSEEVESVEIVETSTTPHEQIEQAFTELQEALEIELLDQVKEMTDTFFERLVVELLVAMGYGGSMEDAGRAVGKSGDGGIDGVIKEDKLGLDVIVIQAKRWTTNNVGRPELQAFAGSMEAYRANKGVFITTSAFSAHARDFVQQIQRKISLIDGRTLASLMIEHGVGVSSYRTIHLKRLDTDYFQE